MVDGSDNNDISVTIATSQIVPESVAEFQVMQNPYSVEFGRNSGGQINVITKSGTQPLPGRLLRLLPVERPELADNIEKANNLATPAKLIRHQLGGDLGGPVFRDKLFFFGLYQRDSQRPANRPADDDPDPDAGRLCGAPERAAARRPVRRAARRSCSRSGFFGRLQCQPRVPQREQPDW